MNYKISHIARIIQAEAPINDDTVIEHLLLDSRKVYAPASSLFFALKGDRRDGHLFIADLYKKGVRNFVVSEKIDTMAYPGANFLLTRDTLKALQQLAGWHRQHFSVPVIGITGSNGKTIVKEWLYQLLHNDYNIVRSPKSYNSQIGVPLSVWQMNEQHTLAIFEAGISQPGEMDKLEKIIRPTIGILTNIGEAHSDGFSTAAQKEAEKRLLFREAEQPPVLELTGIKKQPGSTFISAKNKKDPAHDISIGIPFTDDASIQNAVSCWQLMLMLGYDNAVIAGRMKLLTPVNMRLELKKGINHCSIINDSYSADLSSLEIALNFLDQQSGGTNKTVILSDFQQSGLPAGTLYQQILNSLKKYRVNRVIAIGTDISGQLRQLLNKPGEELQPEFYTGTEDFIRAFRSTMFREETILVKGARTFAFEQIVQLLEQKVHQTVLEINLNAIVHNLKEYQKIVQPSTKVMAMVKAFAYGSGGAEIAGILQYHKVDYLGVAYADEGVELRKAGISLPVMVMNPEESAFEAITYHNLEPELYSFEMLHAFDKFLQQEGLQQYPVHIEIETGMNRLGFSVEEMEKLLSVLQSTVSFKVQSVFSHLAASEEKVEDSFTQEQFHLFEKASRELQTGLGYDFIRHIANSAGVVRHPQLQMDMVRLGIGLYGVDSANSGKLNLQTVATLKSTIAQLKQVKKGESVSYNRKTRVQKDSLIATIRMGYADGYPRRLGNGNGSIWLNGQLVPLVGTVCMDMFMVDVTGIPGVKEGDDVIIFGAPLPVQQLARWADTIPYEIMTGISQRVKRVYFEE
ncbi:MAG: alanine racemase [Chitinophagaceae bacterium]